MIIKLRFFEELNDFLPLDKRKVPFDHSVIINTSVKDVIESLGVPHTEVEVILVNGKSVNFTYQTKPNDIICVYPVFEAFDVTDLIRLRPKPLRVTRFILDVHLGKLTRHLRLLGFDAQYDNHYSDESIINYSVKEKRIILTRDKGLLKNKIVIHGYLVRNTNPDKQIIEVLQRFDLKNQFYPFSRCLECNGLLREIEKSKLTQIIPTSIKKYYEYFTQCEWCKKIYWEGTHYHKLKKWIAHLKL